MSDTTVDPVFSRARLLHHGRRLAFPVPDGIMAAIFAIAAMIEFLPPERLAALPPALFQHQIELIFALVVEGGFLMMQGTLVDIATRLKKRPPVWLGILIIVVVVIFSGQALDVLRIAWQRGALVFVPLLLSLAERGTMLWQMPLRSRIEKIAARALISNRIVTALALLAMVTVAMLTGVNAAWAPLSAGAIYFAVAAFDDWRVRGKRFAETPRVLFRYDILGITYLDPL